MKVFAKEYGIGFSLAVHWLLYYFALFNNHMDWGFDGRLNYSIQWGSLPFLAIAVLSILSKYFDDCNTKYLFACIFSLSLRMVVICFKPWGYEGSFNTMVFCGLAMIIFFTLEWSNKRSKNRYFKY